MIKKLLLSGMLFLATTAFAKDSYQINPAVQPPTSPGIPSAATGHWRSSLVIGFELQMVVGQYYVSQGWGVATCGTLLRVDAAVPKVNPNESVHGRVNYFDANAGAVPTGVPFNMIKVFRPGLVGTFTLNSYDPSTDTISVTFTSTNGPNGTFTLYRDLLMPKLVPLNPC